MQIPGPKPPAPPLGYEYWRNVPRRHGARLDLLKWRKELRDYITTVRRRRAWWKRILDSTEWEVPLKVALALEVYEEEGLLS